MPEGKEKDRIHNALMNEMDKIDTTSYGPTAKATPKDSPAPAAAAPVVPSNKGADNKTAALPPPKSKDLAVDGQRYDLGDKGIFVWDKASDKFLPEAEYKKSKPTTPAAKDTEKGFPTRTVKPFTPPPVVKKEESIEDIERDIAKLKRENAATDKRIEKLKKQNAPKSKVDDEKESQKEVEKQIERLKKAAEGA